MADSEHVALARSGASAIARWRELNYMIPNPSVIQYSLSYRLEDRSVSETFEREFVHGRSKLDLSGAFLTRAKLAGADLAYDNLSNADLTGCNLRFAVLDGANLQSAHLSRSNLTRASFNRASMAGCFLVRSDLSSSNLELTDLRGADLSFANLNSVNLEGANLSGANLSSADLSWANLRQANLRGADLTGTSLKMADLTRADLREAYIINADLESVVFQNALLGITKFINCDLSTTIGLEMAIHAGPSTIGLDTLGKSGGSIPKAFLHNAGVAAPLIEAQDALRGATRRFPSVLIVGSKGDRELADRLRISLGDSSIPCWNIAADDEAALQSGSAVLAHTIYYDRVVLLCTAQSLESPQASQYFAELVGKSLSESKGRIMVLAAAGRFYDREDQLCTTLREGLVVDFRGWESAKVYQEAVASLAGVLSGRRS